jgi:hypothetical protein
VHAVLHLQPDGLDTQQPQPLKQALGQARLSSTLAHDHGGQLAMVTNKDYLGGVNMQDNMLGVLKDRIQ